jgi:hypothetical protein
MDQAKVDEILRDLERSRRAKDYSGMSNYTAELLDELNSESSPAAFAARSKASYEHHMAEWDLRRIDESETYALQSAREADHAGDPVGRLFAEMNISGLIRPRQGKWQEGLALSSDVCQRAEQIAAETGDETTRKRAQRVAMNTYFHRIKILLDHEGDRQQVHRLLLLAEANPIYQSNPDPFKDLVNKTIGYIGSH